MTEKKVQPISRRKFVKNTAAAAMGTGAAIAYPLLAAAACFYNEMASFEAAGIKEV